MNPIVLELKKGKRSGVTLLLPAAGVLGALYASANYLVRKESLLRLPLDPMDILLTQLYGVELVLNLFAIVAASCISYYVESCGSAVKKLYTLPVGIPRMYACKWGIQSVLLLIAVLLENLALLYIGLTDLPPGAFHLDTLIGFAVYSYLTSLPVLSFMMLVSSRCESVWIPLGIGVAGFLSGMALAVQGSPVWQVHPFVVMLSPAVAMSAKPEPAMMAVAAAETLLFSGAGLLLAKTARYE